MTEVNVTLSDAAAKRIAAIVGSDPGKSALRVSGTRVVTRAKVRAARAPEASVPKAVTSIAMDEVFGPATMASVPGRVMRPTGASS